MTTTTHEEPKLDGAGAARLVVVETVYHGIRESGRDATTRGVRISRELVSDEQPYDRVRKVGTDWSAVETGWLKGADVSVLLIRANESECDLELGVENPAGDLSIIPFARVAVGDSIRMTPVGLAVFIRATGEGGKVSITAYPK